MSNVSQFTQTQTRVTAFVICGLAALFYVYDYFIQVAPSIMTQQLMRSFDIGAAELGILSASFFYSYTLMQIPSGLLLDRLGARKILTVAVLFSAVGVLMFGMTTHFWVAAASRFLIGLGSACAFISAIFLVSRWVSPHRFAVIAGVIQLAGCLGSLFGQAPLALVINRFGWRQSMIVIGVITFALVFVYGFLIRDGAKPAQSETISLSNEWQRLRYVVRQSHVWWVFAIGLICWIPVGAIGALWGVPYLMAVYGWTNVVAGQMCSLFWVGLGVGSPLLGWYANRAGKRRQPVEICFVLAIAGSVLLLLAPHVSPWITAMALLLLGTSASIQAFTFSLINDSVPKEVFGTASGLINMAAILGGGVAQTVIGFILRYEWKGAIVNDVPAYAVSNYQWAFSFLVVTAVVGFLIARFRVKH